MNISLVSLRIAGGIEWRWFLPSTHALFVDKWIGTPLCHDDFLNKNENTEPGRKEKGEVLP